MIWSAFAALLLVGIVRLLLGTRFDRLHQHNPARWLVAYFSCTLAQATIWGALNAFLIWEYHTDWPAMLISFATAGLVAGGTLSTNTHTRLQRPYIVMMLLPSALICWSTGDAGAAVMGIFFVADILFLQAVGRRLNRDYWDGLRNTRLLKRRADELEKARELAEHADRAKSLFMARVSHELRTPLNGLIATLSMMEKQGAPAKHDNHLDILIRSADLLLQRINDLLDFSKIEADKLTLETIDMDPARVMRDAASLMFNAAQTKQLRLNATLETPAVVPVVGDPSRITQVLLNLLSNAIKFTASGAVNISLAQRIGPGGKLICRYVVQDTGIGISSHDRERIFESFEQADGSTTRQYGGTGLGLAVARDLIGLMEGTIELQSEPGEGSRFIIEIPLPEAKAPAPLPEANTAPPTASSYNLSILVAEDNAINQLIIEEMLASLGCRCDLTVDGQACIDRHREGNYDLILMDCEMPNVDGYEATRQIRNHEEQQGRQAIPVIALSAHADEASRGRAYDCGMTDFVTKPYTLDELQAALTRAIRVHNENA